MNLRRIHIYLGLLLSIPLLLIATTGIILGLSNSVRQTQWPYYLTQPSTQKKISPDSIISQLQSTYPRLNVDSFYLSTQPNQTVRVEMTDAITGSEHRIFLNPFTAEILIDQSPIPTDALDWVYKIHRGTWAGWNGRMGMSLLGVLVFLLWPTGWIVRKFRMRVQLIPLEKLPNLKTSLKLHRSLGYFFGGGISFMALSGALMNFNKDLIRYFDPAPQNPSKQSPLRESLITQLDKKIAISSSVRLQSPLESIHFQNRTDSIILFYFKDNARVYLDSDTLQIKKVMSPRSHWIHALYPLHSGKIFGSLSSLFILAVGTLLLSLLIAGIQYANPRKILRLY